MPPILASLLACVTTCLRALALLFALAIAAIGLGLVLAASGIASLAKPEK